VALPQQFLQHLREKGYNPRSNKHSDALSEAIVSDLVANCPSIRHNAALGLLVYALNFDLVYATSQWNVDLVLGTPPPNSPPPDEGAIRRSEPSTVQIAIELKSVMTEHHKAVKNRKRDFEAHHEHVHNYSNAAIAGGVMLINASPTFKSPLRNAITVHAKPTALVAHCLQEMSNVSMRGGPTGYGLDAKAGLVVSMDNEVWPSTAFVTTPPAPSIGDPMHYDAFIQRLCAEYSARF